MTALLPPLAAGRKAICHRCPRWTGRECGLSLIVDDCYRRRPGAVCPDTPPRWKPFAPTKTPHNTPENQT